MKTHEPSALDGSGCSAPISSPGKEFQVSNECATEPMWGPRYQKNHRASQQQQQQQQQQQHGAKVNPRSDYLEYQSATRVPPDLCMRPATVFEHE